MEKKEKVKELKKELRFFYPAELEFAFLPLKSGEKGAQTFLKLEKEGEEAFLYTGEEEEPALSADLQKPLLVLRNQGWEIAGEVVLSFSGQGEVEGEGEGDKLFCRAPLTLELGLKLLPLVDPRQGSPLSERIPVIREEVAQETGLVIPGIRLCDNLTLGEECYLFKFRESPLARGEVFLGRLLAIGNNEQLSGLTGWSTLEPAYKMAGKWLEEKEVEKAKTAGCMVVSPLNVLLTHLKTVLLSNAPRLLGLQDLSNLLKKLAETHPVVVEDFLNDLSRLRSLRKILQNLLSEGISIRDLVTILETLGDHLKELEKTELMAEFVRMAISRELVASFADREGKLRALFLAPQLEELVLYSLKETSRGVQLKLEKQEAEELINAVKSYIQESLPCVLITDPPTRIYWKRLLGLVFPHLPVLSTLEITPETRLEILATVPLPKELKPAWEKKRSTGKKGGNKIK